MTTPKEGHADPGEDSAAGGTSRDEPVAAKRRQPRTAGGRVTDAGETPPWQRGTGRPRPATTESAEAQNPPVAHSPGVEARLNRFITGTAAPAALAAAGAARDKPAEPGGVSTEGSRVETYASELPDLSEPKPKPARKPAAETTTEKPTPAAGGVRTAERRVQVAAKPRGPVRASMQIRRIDPWSTLKVSLLLSVALFFAWMIAVAVLYLLLGSMGVWAKLNSNVDDLLTNTGGGDELVSSGTVFGGAALIGLINIVLLTAMATIGALVYNLTTDVVGGIEVTLADRD